MKNVTSKERSTFEEMAKPLMEENSVEQLFDKDKAHQYFLQLSNKVNYWGEGFYDHEEWSI